MEVVAAVEVEMEAVGVEAVEAVGTVAVVEAVEATFYVHQCHGQTLQEEE